MNKLNSIKEVWEKYKFILTPSQKKLGIVVILMTLLGAICETLGVSIILPLVQVMIAPQQLRENEVLSPIIAFMGIESDNTLVWIVGLAVIIVYIIKNLYLLLLSYVRVKYSCKVQRELSNEMLNYYIKRGYIFFLNTGTGELLRGVNDSIYNTYTGMYQLFKLMAEAMTIFFICIYIMITDIGMAFCVVGLALICLAAVIFGFQKWVKRCGEIQYKYTAQINKVLIQTFQGIKEILVLKRGEYFKDSYRALYIKKQKGVIGQTVAAESPAYMIEGVCVAGLIIAVCIKATDTENAAMLVPQLASFAVAAFRILPSLGKISNNYNLFIFSLPGLNDAYTNLKEARKFEESKEEKREKGTKEITFEKKLTAENITWRYPGSNSVILDNISIEIKKGQSVGIVGKSGSGKTTLADIILGLLQPEKGSLKVDGIDFSEISEERSRLIGFVPQNVSLLDDTVRRNVAFGIADNDIDDDEVWKALEQAQLKEVIKKCPDGLDTEIGERGLRFSGGQKQRIAIARALYMNPDILVLDEATSALDNETEKAVMESIHTLQGYKTLIIIAHRLTTIENCDVIYEIENGKAVQKTYDQLQK